MAQSRGRAGEVAFRDMGGPRKPEIDLVAAQSGSSVNEMEWTLMHSKRPGEDELIARYFAPMAAAGGLSLLDDTALFSAPVGHDLILTQDALVAGVHFFSEDPAKRIAQKALRVNLSDLAAKAAEPAGFLLTLVLPRDWTPDWLQQFADGLAEDAGVYSVPLFGGDTVKTPGPLCLSVTAFGLVPSGSMVKRSGIQPGDRLYVTGTIGDAALGLRIGLNHQDDQRWVSALPRSARDFLIDRYQLPRPRLDLRSALRETAHAGMDISDGLIGDISKMMRVSGVTGRVELAKIPLSMAASAAIASQSSLFEVAVTGGDDYELIVAVPAQRAPDFERLAVAAGVPVTAIAEVFAGDAPPLLVAQDGTEAEFVSGSFSHF